MPTNTQPSIAELTDEVALIPQPNRPAMVRPAQPEDKSEMMTVIAAIGLFPPDELEGLDTMLTDYFAGTLGNDHFWITDDDGTGSVGIAYYAPERMTNGTWNLYLIGVHPDRQGQGRGAAMLRYVEQTLAERDERVLLVETSGLDSFAPTRAFYHKCGYDEEARIREFYNAGDDKIVFRKALTTASAQKSI